MGIRVRKACSPSDRYRRCRVARGRENKEEGGVRTFDPRRSTSIAYSDNPISSERKQLSAIQKIDYARKIFRRPPDNAEARLPDVLDRQ